MIEITADNYEKEVTESALPVVLDFWGPQCGPCLALMPEVEKLAAAFEGKIKFCKVNVQGNRRLCISLKVMGVPSFLFIKNGEVGSRITGEEANIETIREKASTLAG